MGFKDTEPWLCGNEFLLHLSLAITLKKLINRKLSPEDWHIISLSDEEEEDLHLDGFKV